MPTVDRKNTDTDEKHSLSSFDKRKVQSVTFGAKQLERKKYRVVKHETLSPRAALKENVCCPVDMDLLSFYYTSVILFGVDVGHLTGTFISGI